MSAPLSMLRMVGLAAAAARAPAPGSEVYRWPNVLGTTWVFDQGSNFGFMAAAGNGIKGPAADWAPGSQFTPVLTFDAVTQPIASARPSSLSSAPTQFSATTFPGTVVLAGASAAGVDVRVQHAFANANVSALAVSLSVPAAASASAATVRLVVSGSGANITSSTAHDDTAVVRFALAPNHDAKCFDVPDFAEGSFRFPPAASSSAGTPVALTWSVTVKQPQATSWTAVSSPVTVRADETVTAGVVVTTTGAPPPPGTDGAAVVQAALQRWDGYLGAVLRPASKGAGVDVDTAWAAVKAVKTLMYNWRFVPGHVNMGVLPSYTGYGSGMWSWDTYKQAVGMVGFAPNLATQQLRLLVAAADPITGHVPDKIDRCGVGGGCNGKPPLLSWAVWEVYEVTKDKAFLAEMYTEIDKFHRWWYASRDVLGVGLCSWSEGMESGMDDGARFTGARTVKNATTGAFGFDFWSVDLNAYLYKEKLTMADMADALGNASGAAHWRADAAALLQRLRSTFFRWDPSHESTGKGFFQDVHYNGTFLEEQGCEGYAALFCNVANLTQAAAVALTLADQGAFFLNFSLPTLSRRDPQYNEKGYWKGPTWLDQTWFAYTGLRSYAASMPHPVSPVLNNLATGLRTRLFTAGQGFKANDTTPLNEHYDASTGQPLGATHFSWSAAHTILWATEKPAAQ